ncbi:MAG: nicotinate (nicotinamide) nucleotide adenylyltransferase [Actinomycetia bacterium]|nr:nicotinate (nicotinamide) nucleotide adenylyltransferase [Actinomycetes bacterium]
MGFVGLLGGTFDPPHIGHLIAALEVRFAAGLDGVVLIPAGDPWQKSEARAITPAVHRLAMVRSAVQGLDGLSVSTVEVDRRGPSYTVDTLRELTSPDTRLALIVGSDAARHLDTWDRYEELPGLADLIMVTRSGSSAQGPSWWPAQIVEMPLIGVSSTDLRRRFTLGEPVDVQTPPSVVAYVSENRLYADGP